MTKKNASCINLQLPIVILKKSIVSDIRHRITYMYINFQQNRESRSVKTVLINLFAIKTQVNLQLPILFFKKIDSFRYASSIKHMYINFQQNRVSIYVKTVHTNLFAKIASCINMQQPIVIIKKLII